MSQPVGCRGDIKYLQILGLRLIRRLKVTCFLNIQFKFFIYLPIPKTAALIQMSYMKFEPLVSIILDYAGGLSH